MSAAYRAAASLPVESDILAEARLMARHARLVERKQLADAWVGSPERDKFQPRLATVVGRGSLGSGIVYLIWFHDIWEWALGFAVAAATCLALFHLSARAFQRLTVKALARAERDLAELQVR